MATRNVSLTEMLDRFVEDRSRIRRLPERQRGGAGGLRLLQAQEEAHRTKIERLRAAIQVGVDQIERGESVLVDWDDLDDWLAERGRSAHT